MQYVFFSYLCKAKHTHNIMGHHQLDNLDYKILRLIASNARIPFLEVARECNVSGAAIHQRVQKLTNLGIIKGSEFTLDSNRIGFETCAYIGVFLQSPGQFKEVIEKLKDIPEVVECHYTTGKYDMFLKIYARNNNHMLQIIHTKLQPLGLARTESIISFKEAFRRQLPIENLATYEKEEIAMEPSEDLADLPEEPVKKKRGRKSNNNNA